MTAAVLQLALLAISFAVLARPLWAGESLTQRIVLALVAVVVGILIGWLGALWARAARPSVPEPPGLEVTRRRFLARSRIVFAVVFGIAAAIVGPFVPELADWPKWASVLLGGAIGALVGVVVGQLFAIQAWIARMPKFR